MTEEERIRRAREGDAAELDRLLAECRPMALRLATAMLGDPDEGEDVFQETCRHVQEDLSRFEGRSSFSTWVCGIALNLARRILRDRARHARPADPAALDGGVAQRGRGVLSSIYARELASNLEAAVEDLPDSLKEAFVLRYLEGLEYEAIAEITGASVRALYVRAHRARALLRESLGPVVDSFWTERA